MYLFERVQRCGRSLHIGFEPQELEELIRNLDPRRLFMVTGVPSKEAGERLLADAVKWTAKYWGKRFS